MLLPFLIVDPFLDGVHGGPQFLGDCFQGLSFSVQLPGAFLPGKVSLGPAGTAARQPIIAAAAQFRGRRQLKPSAAYGALPGPLLVEDSLSKLKVDKPEQAARKVL